MVRFSADRPAVASTRIAMCLLWAIVLSVPAGCGKPPRGGRSAGPAAPKGPTAKQTRVVAHGDLLTPRKPIRFKNQDLAVGYIGSEACAKCHEDQHRSFLETPHSRALEHVRSDDPGDVALRHEVSRRSYEVKLTGADMRHSEQLDEPGPSPEGAAPLRQELEVKYAIGSGNHSRSYLCNLDGFLVESPLTWYASTQSWRMSPGYDRPDHASFQRVVDAGCLFCHAGRVDDEQGRYHPRIHEMSIGCESCHGPGEAHQRYHESTQHPLGTPDDTIVHLGRLTRREAESVCSGCHLRGDAGVTLQGRGLTDFRPGMLIEDHRVDYVRDVADTEMTVVGHVEQMRRSRCYTQTETLTCTSCHDPHFRPRKEDRETYFRNKCVACHTSDDDCGLEKAQRLQQSATDNCMQCHMPTGDTDIPHFAFTHHRIGIHDPEAKQQQEQHPPEVTAALRPIHKVDHLPQVEQDRCQGLAHLEMIGKSRSQVEQDRHTALALQLLTKAHRQGAGDALVEAALARLAWAAEDMVEAAKRARAALAQDPENTDALFVLADCQLLGQQWTEAERLFRQLTTLRRLPDDWLRLGEAVLSQGNAAEAIQLMRKGVEMNPFRPDLYLQFLTAAQLANDLDSARWAVERLERLKRASQREADDK
ncbi:MAG: tetratricopeptide repeat protein [Planctomycetales bacterium]|nr:tetratricopeptide repeat protein [Planctomycetales bacterium]